MPRTMYDRLGDLLNETLEAGHVKFVKVEKQEEIPEQKESSPNKESCSTNASGEYGPTESEPKEKKSSTSGRTTRRVIYKKITSEVERSYRLLDITISASEQDVKKAYKEKIKYYHPDKYEGNPVLKKVATEKTRQVVEAFDIIMKFMEQ